MMTLGKNNPHATCLWQAGTSVGVAPCKPKYLFSLLFLCGLCGLARGKICLETGNALGLHAFTWTEKDAESMKDISQQTIEQCQKGDTAAFAEVVERYERPLFAYVYRLGCTPPGRDVEDVVQEIFVKAYQNMHRYRGSDKGSFSTWLFSIARNHCVSLIRRKQLETQVRRDDSQVLPRRKDSHAPSPSDTLSQRETVAQVIEAIGRLPETLRSAFILRHYHDCSCVDIGVILQCNVGTVRSRLFRARQAVLQTLQESDPHFRRTGYATS